jgi:hypothetical protein
MRTHAEHLKSVADAAERNAVAAAGQLGAMQAQLGEMQASGGRTVTLIEVARKSADAASESAQAASASVETFISKERARIKVKVHPFETNQPNVLIGHAVRYSVICVGPTMASIDHAVAEATLDSSKEPPTEDIIFGSMDLGPFISPGSAPIDLEERTSVLSESERNRIAQGAIFLHFRGLIKYRDFMEIERETAFCYTWKVISTIPYFPLSEWEASGPPGANRET